MACLTLVWACGEDTSSNGSDGDATIRTACTDGVDNDGDGLVDLEDPGCDGPDDEDERGSLQTQACSDGADNDDDGLIDLDDPGCEDSSDDDESNAPEPTECDDGTDNDDDGEILSKRSRLYISGR